MIERPVLVAEVSSGVGLRAASEERGSLSAAGERGPEAAVVADVISFLRSLPAGFVVGTVTRVGTVNRIAD